MSPRMLRSLFGTVAVLSISLAGAGLSAQAPAEAPRAAAAAKKPSAASSKHAVKRTPWGDPDLQGTWDYRTITPLERPQNMGDRQFLTDAEAATLKTRAAKRLDEPPDESTPANTIHAPYWTDPGRRVLDDKRTSLIIDPPDGRLPPLTPEGQYRLATGGRGGTGGREGGKADGPEDRSTLERCITQGLPTSNLPTLYNNNVGIYQSPGYVALVHEMVHETRIVPLDGRPALSPGIRQWEGSSRGHWDGDTLVVETTNFTDKTRFRGSTENLKVTERFSRLDGRTLRYQFTVEDPNTWTRPWTAEYAWPLTGDQLYEYACHEGNYAMGNILRGARLKEKEEAEKKSRQQ